MEIWGSHLSNQKILFFSDNLTVVQVFNKQSCKDKTLMKLVRRLVVSAMKYNILFKAKQILGKQNALADYLSRFKFKEAKKIAPWLDLRPTVLPNKLIYIKVSLVNNSFRHPCLHLPNNCTPEAGLFYTNF